jgi:hypothetical protein
MACAALAADVFEALIRTGVKVLRDCENVLINAGNWSVFGSRVRRDITTVLVTISD